MLELIAACAPDVAPTTIAEIIRVESAGNPLAINVNRLNGKPAPSFSKPKTSKEAVSIAVKFMRRGHSVDMGLMQINSAHLRYFGLTEKTLERAFNPCANIAMGAEILSESYQRALKSYPDPQSALRAALSAYNTGHFERGFNNGYVSKYYSTGPPTFDKAAVDSPTAVLFEYPYEQMQGKIMTQDKDETPTKTDLDAIDPLLQKIEYMETPGAMVEFDPDEAEAMGAFSEDALDFEDAVDASTDPREAP